MQEMTEIKVQLLSIVTFNQYRLIPQPHTYLIHPISKLADSDLVPLASKTTGPNSSIVDVAESVKLCYRSSVPQIPRY